MSGKKLSGAKRRKRNLELEKEACKSSKVIWWFLKKANIEGGNEGNEELVALEGN